MDESTKTEITLNADRINAIIGSHIFDSNKVGHPLIPSAITELLICLRDLLAKAEKYAKRIDFTDDICITADVSDVTDAVIWCRDAVCHVHTRERRLGKFVFAFNIVHGKAGLLSIGSKSFRSDYTDDVCFFFGEQKLYLKRHIIRAFQEVLEALRIK